MLYKKVQIPESNIPESEAGLICTRNTGHCIRLVLSYTLITNREAIYIAINLFCLTKQAIFDSYR